MPAATYLPNVYEITDRPDLVNESISALTRALRQAHLSSDYFPDISSVFVPNVNAQDFAFALPARFRRVFSIDGPDFHVREVTPGALFDPQVYASGKENSYYLAGTNANFHVEGRFTNLVFQFLRFPTFEDSFIITNFVDAVTALAASYVFSSIKDKAQADKWAGIAGDTIREIITSNFVCQQS